MTLCCKYNSGMLREAITIQRRVDTQDEDRNLITVWQTVSGAPTYAMVRQSSGRERFASNRVEATSSFVFVMRYSDTFDESARIVHRGRNYNIRSINNVEFQDEWLEVSATLGEAD